MKRVLVTGANGHLGNNLCRLLVEKGYEVRASLRDANDPQKREPLADLDVELVSADIMRPETLAPAMEGISGVFQVAAVYQTWAKDPQREIVEPSVVGGLNVLRAAHEAGVRRVVFTSSCAAVGTQASPHRPLTEDDWSEPQSPYMVAKTVAERRAWDFAKETGLDLVVVNPTGILGPRFYRHTPTTEGLELLVRGKMPAAPPLGFSFVDVRDVAEAHRLVYESDDAHGRYICSDRFLEFIDLTRQVAALYPDIKAPRFVLPRASLGLLASGDWLINKLSGRPRQLTRQMINEFAGKEQHVSADKLRRELGWTPRPFEACLRDTIDWLRARFVIKSGR